MQLKAKKKWLFINKLVYKTWIISRNIRLIMRQQNNWYPICLVPDSVTDMVFATGTIFRLEEQSIFPCIYCEWINVNKAGVYEDRQ